MAAGRLGLTATNFIPVDKTAAMVASRSSDNYEPKLDGLSLRPLALTLNFPPEGIIQHKLSSIEIGRVTILGVCKNGLLVVRCACGLYEYRKREWAHKNKDKKKDKSLTTCAPCESREKSKIRQPINSEAKEWRKSLELGALAERHNKTGKPIDCTKKSRKHKHEVKD